MVNEYKNRQPKYKLVFLLFFSASVILTTALADDQYTKARQAMIKAIKDDVEMTSLYIGRDHFSDKVMAAMEAVPRHEFVPVREKVNAYKNRPLPIGHGQTISQPYIVALMTDMLEIESNHRILEIGTGSGYQAAILNELSSFVYTIEIIEPLGVRAEKTFDRLKLNNINIKIGDGYYGWEEHAPFDAIVVTAAASHVPPPLVKQLKPGGRMIIPVGSRFLVQQLVLVEKSGEGKVTSKQILPVRFVPLTGDH